MSAQDSEFSRKFKLRWQLALLYVKRRLFTKKFGSVVLSFLATAAIGFFCGSFFAAPDKELLVTGLIIAAMGQLAESAAKSSDVQASESAKDGFELYGEGVKFMGSLIAILGAVLALET